MISLYVKSADSQVLHFMLIIGFTKSVSPVSGSVALVEDCGRISFQTIRWLMRETRLAKRASPAINTTQC
jgi:hypothetical protein